MSKFISDKNFTRAGDRFSIDGETYILATHTSRSPNDNPRASLINLQTGNRWGQSEQAVYVVGVPVETMIHNFGNLSHVTVKRVRRGKTRTDLFNGRLNKSLGKSIRQAS